MKHCKTGKPTTIIHAAKGKPTTKHAKFSNFIVPKLKITIDLSFSQLLNYKPIEKR
jgi:hypothetical protein